MKPCIHKEPDRVVAPYTWKCKEGWIWAGQECEKTCMYKQTQPVYEIRLTEKQCKDLLEMIMACDLQISDEPESKYLRRMAKITKKLKDVLE